MPIMVQILQIPCLTGDRCATGVSFAEWHEHFENVTRLVGWDEHWKLAHLTSNLRDTAIAFYRSCHVDIRNQLVAAMTAVQAQLFLNRQQQEKETVDQFTQEQQKL